MPAWSFKSFSRFFSLGLLIQCCTLVSTFGDPSSWPGAGFGFGVRTSEVGRVNLKAYFPSLTTLGLSYSQSLQAAPCTVQGHPGDAVPPLRPPHAALPRPATQQGCPCPANVFYQSHIQTPPFPILGRSQGSSAGARQPRQVGCAITDSQEKTGSCLWAGQGEGELPASFPLPSLCCPQHPLLPTWVPSSLWTRGLIPALGDWGCPRHLCGPSIPAAHREPRGGAAELASAQGQGHPSPSLLPPHSATVLQLCLVPHHQGLATVGKYLLSQVKTFLLH